MATPKPGSATYAGHELAAGAKLSLAQARAIALKARPGKIVDQELEKESGGSGLRYAFDVKSHATTFEVGVDAMTGKVLENARESPAKEAAEAKAEKVGAKR
ncbi:MAG: PepSY domain-containing protein [Phenylobacterium sp.]|nr:PepSY domain-containing protein [Phenylobacterium sp.]